MHCTEFHQHILFEVQTTDEMAQKNGDALVEDYMTTRMITINQKSSVLEVAKRMVERNISSVAITDEKDRIAGILTERDIVKVLAKGVPANGVTASSLMTRPVESISKDSPIEDAARTMALKNIRHLTVKDPNSQQVIGIITLTDLARYLKQNITYEDIGASEVWELFF